jgi:hypothetical protein
MIIDADITCTDGFIEYEVTYPADKNPKFEKVIANCMVTAVSGN